MLVDCPSRCSIACSWEPRCFTSVVGKITHPIINHTINHVEGQLARNYCTLYQSEGERLFSLNLALCEHQQQETVS